MVSYVCIMVIRWILIKLTVHCYSDIQKFLKRVRINLKRHFDYVKPFTYFACLEYGKYLLPHAFSPPFVHPQK